MCFKFIDRIRCFRQTQIRHLALAFDQEERGWSFSRHQRYQIEDAEYQISKELALLLQQRVVPIRMMRFDSYQRLFMALRSLESSSAPCEVLFNSLKSLTCIMMSLGAFFAFRDVRSPDSTEEARFESAAFIKASKTVETFRSFHWSNPGFVCDCGFVSESPRMLNKSIVVGAASFGKG